MLAMSIHGFDLRNTVTCNYLPANFFESCRCLALTLLQSCGSTGIPILGTRHRDTERGVYIAILSGGDRQHTCQVNTGFMRKCEVFHYQYQCWSEGSLVKKNHRHVNQWNVFVNNIGNPLHTLALTAKWHHSECVEHQSYGKNQCRSDKTVILNYTIWQHPQ